MAKRRPSTSFADAVKQVWHSLRGREDKPISKIKNELMVELQEQGLLPDRSRDGYSNPLDYWGKGYVPANPRIVDFFAEVGVSRAQLPPEWLDRFLRSAGYSEPVRQERRRALFASPEGAGTILPPDLPLPDYPEFVGRSEELKEVKRLLLPYPRGIHSVITIAGVAGVGKTTLAREIASHYLRDHDSLPKDERFEVIIWFSAKASSLTAIGIKPRFMIDRTLDDLYRRIALQLGKEELLEAPADKRDHLIYHELRSRRTLIIVDNLESVDDDRLLSFLSEPPAPTKIIVTTRHLIEAAYPVRVLGMNRSDALALIEGAQRERENLADSQKLALFERTGGVPLALLWSVAQICPRYSFETTLRMLADSEGDVSRFCYEAAMKPLRGSDAHKILMGLTFFSRGANREAVGQIAGLDEDVPARDEGLVKLDKLSLVNRHSGQYSMLPLTRQYASAELASEPQFDTEAFDRWIEWVIRETAATAVVVDGHEMFERDRQIKSGATDRVWLLNASLNEISLHQELRWVEDHSKDRLELLLARLDSLRHHVAQIRYYDDLVRRALNGQFHYIRIIQCPEGNITPDNTGSHYLRHLNRMIKRGGSSKEGIRLAEALLYEAQQRRNKTFAIVDRSTILIQENERRDRLDRMAALRVLYDPHPEVLESFEFIFEEVLRNSTRLSSERVELLHSALPSLYDEFREPVGDTLRQFLRLNEASIVDRAAGLIEEMLGCEHPEMRQVLVDVIDDLRSDSEIDLKMKAVTQMLVERNPELGEGLD